MLHFSGFQGTAEALSINFATGNVGIGTTVPTAALDVSGNLKVSGTMFGGNIQTGVLSPPNWGYSSTSASWVEAWNGTLNVPKASVVVLTLSGHILSSVGGNCVYSSGLDGVRNLPTVGGYAVAGAPLITSTNWVPLSETKYFTATAAELFGRLPRSHAEHLA